MIHIRRRFVSILILCATAGCTTDGPRASAIQTRDSAGIHIVENSGPDLQLKLVEHGRIGSEDGDERYLFGQIAGVAGNDQGQIFVGDEISLSISRYSTEGKFEARFGRRGQGPGELRSLKYLVVEGDSVWVGDWMSPTATVVFTVEGRPVDRRAYRTSTGDELFLTGADRYGLVLAGSRTVEAQGDVRQQMIDLYRAPTAGDRAGQPVLTILGPKLGRTPIGGYDWPLFEIEPGWAVGADGFFSSDGRTYRVVIHDTSGTPLRIVRRRVEPRPVRDKDIKAAVREQAERWNPKDFPPGSESREDLAERAERRAGLAVRSHFAVTGQIVPIRGGGFWVERPDQASRPHALDIASSNHRFRARIPIPWDRFDTNGQYSGTAVFPANFRVHFADSLHLTGVSWNEDDVQFVVRLRVTRPTGN